MSDIDARRRKAKERIDAISADLRQVSLSIHENPETNWQEHHAHKVLTGYLEAEGFHVERGAFGMETAFRAVAGQGGPVIAVMCEYDALPGIGHACGHNLIAISGLAAAAGMLAVLEPGEGTVVVLGSPAEEGGHGKVYMVERGAFEGVDAAMMLHPGPGDNAWANVVAIHEVKLEYRGRNAHAAAAPWEGVNALDAVVMAFNGVNALRQQIKPTDKVHGVITHGGLRPNIIPDFTSADFYVRARNMAELEVLKERVVGCFEGAAMATGCSLTLAWEPRATSDMLNNDVMAAAYAEHMMTLGVRTPSKERGMRYPAGSTDMGNVSYALPAIHPHFGIPTPSGNHTPGFTAAAATPEAHENTLRAAKGMALTGLDLFLREGVLDAAVKEFRERRGK
ncbi:MAG: M20 family metallopeptidase [Dehalococcoidia bacterium]